MAFRDETEALRARIGALEVELSESRERVEQLERDEREVAALEARIAQLEAELAKLSPQPAPTTSRPKDKRALRVAMAGMVVVGLAGVAFYAASTGWGPDLEAEPERGVLTLDDAPLPPGIDAIAVGSTEVGAGCPGYVSSSPLVVLRASRSRQVRLWTESGSDLVLYVHTADGRVICDDDSGEGMNASLMADLGPGDHRVWVGTYSSGGRAPFTLRIDGRDPEEAALALDGEATLGTVRIEGVDRHVRDGRASGDNPAVLARPNCPGHVPSAPHLDLNVQEVGVARIVARGREDLVLLVRRPDGSFVCDDDAAGDLDPMVTEDLQEGRYRVWVGTYNAGRVADFQLSVEVDAPPPPDPNASPRLGRWNLDGEALLSFSERVTGRTPVSSTHPECRTLYGSETPDLEMALSEDRTVTLNLTSDAFVGVLVEHPDGTQTCHPTVSTQPESWSAGTHRLWVASPEPDAAAQFTLVVQTQPR